MGALGTSGCGGGGLLASDTLGKEMVNANAFAFPERNRRNGSTGSYA